MKKTLSMIALLFCSACASILEGTTQEIHISTSPSEAQCNITRNGVNIAHIASTPGAALVERTKHDLFIKCSKDDCEDAEFFAKSGTSGGTFGNIILGGGIGWAIDSAAGADNEYPEAVNLSLSCESPKPKKKKKKKED